MINFIDSSYSNCLQQIRNHESIWDNYGDQLILIAINVDPSYESNEEFQLLKEDLSAQWIMVGDTSNIKDLYGIKEIPTIVMIDKEGYMWARHVGLTDSATLEDEIEQLISHWKIPTPSVKFESISIENAKNLIDSKKDCPPCARTFRILDVRTIEEFNESHLENAMHIPVQELQERIDELEKNHQILVYCKSGVRSIQASQILVENGFTRVYNIEGGIMAWINASFPIIE